METLISIITIPLDSYVQFLRKIKSQGIQGHEKVWPIRSGGKSTETATEKDPMADTQIVKGKSQK